MKTVGMFVPYVECEVKEIISYEKVKETIRALRGPLQDQQRSSL
jgi:hypothetical protein